MDEVDLVAPGLDPDRLEVPVCVGIRDPLVALDRLEVTELLDPAGGGEVVEDRLVPGEPLEAHDLFGQEAAVVAELDVALARDVAADLIRGHGGRLPRPDSVPERPDPLDVELDDVARLEPAAVAVLEDATGADGPRAEDVARMQHGVPRRMLDDRVPRVVHVGELATGAFLAVHPRDHRRGGAVELV